MNDLLSPLTIHWVGCGSTLQPNHRVIAAETTTQYREAALRYVAPDDIVLEVGCHEGVTTAMVYSQCQSIVGVDMSQETIDAARAKFPHIRFEVLDGANVEALKALCPAGEGGFDKVRFPC